MMECGGRGCGEWDRCGGWREARELRTGRS